MIQRVNRARVGIEGVVIGSIGKGLLVFVGATHGDSEMDARAVAEKVASLRVFSDDDGQMNLSVTDISGAVMVISQFTVYGTISRGRRPSFTAAAAPGVAEPLIELVATSLERRGLEVARGRFGAKMEVDLIN
ncbi:MAG TPA: D-aminoacyl-tRNA deacylase, partial [Acidimicrobiia bacterium]|nr:D-aminoacyl-tRNA deacylase [Acidimicrobiia bacterium]